MFFSISSEGQFYWLNYKEKEEKRKQNTCAALFQRFGVKNQNNGFTKEKKNSRKKKKIHEKKKKFTKECQGLWAVYNFSSVSSSSFE